jgi:membrane protein required for beta-lactamase induction
VRALKPPAKYQAEVSQLAGGFDSVAADMTAVSTAAKNNDAKAAQTAAKKLVTDSATVHNADLKLTQALGLKATG